MKQAYVTQNSGSTTQQSQSVSYMDEQLSLIDQVVEAYREIFPNQLLQNLRTYQFSKDPITESNKVLSAKFDSTSKFIASGCEDGTINIIYITKDLTTTQLINSAEKPGPVACVKWRPGQSSENLKNTLLATYSNGNVIYWHATSKQALYRIHEQDNQVNCCDFTIDGNKFATGGSDCKIRLYDCGKMSKPPTTLEAGSVPVHSNRVFGVKFHPNDPNAMYSGGWDKLVLQWDLRQKKSVGFIYGVNIYGDSIDIKGNLLVTASYRDENQLEVWDTRNLKKVSNIDWLEYGRTLKSMNLQKQTSKIYSCCFDKQKNYIYAASMGTFYSEIRVFDGSSYKCIDSYCQLDSGVLSIDHSSMSSKLCYGQEDGRLGLMNVIN